MRWPRLARSQHRWILLLESIPCGNWWLTLELVCRCKMNRRSASIHLRLSTITHLILDSLPLKWLKRAGTRLCSRQAAAVWSPMHIISNGRSIWAAQNCMDLARVQSPRDPSRSCYCEMDKQWIILCQLLLHRRQVSGWIHVIREDIDIDRKFYIPEKSIDYFHALTFDCDAPMEFEIIKSSVVVVRGLSSEHVRLKLTVGTNYKDLLDELRKDSGFEKNILPYWAHGIHIYDNILR